uniref:Uncharacterized protein n=1 Tax=Pelusios castaneus TaxID=367368 RepID=A0A8C8SHG1_9SAUR
MVLVLHIPAYHHKKGTGLPKSVTVSVHVQRLEVKEAAPFSSLVAGICSRNPCRLFWNQHPVSLLVNQHSARYAYSSASPHHTLSTWALLICIQVNKALKMRRRTYRAHDHINPSMSPPCRIEMILTEKEQIVPKPEEEVAQKKKVSQKKLKKQKLMAWE